MNNYRITLLILLLLPLNALAVQEVVFRKTTMVYENQSKDAAVLTVYEKGERAPLSSKTYGTWRKIVVDIDGTQKVGWVLAEDIKGARIIERSEPFDYEVYHLNKGSIGILGAFNFVSHGGQTIDSEGSYPPNVEVSSLSGGALYFGVYSDLHWKQDFSIHLELLFRKASRSGPGTFIAGSDAEVELDQSFMSLGAMGKWYLAPESNFWYGAGLEIAKLSTSKMIWSVNGGDEFVANEKIESPVLFMLTGGLGLDIHVVRRFFVLPEVRGGLMVSDPLVFVFELRLPVVYTW